MYWLKLHLFDVLIWFVVYDWLPRKWSRGVDQDGLSIALINERRRWRECREKGQRRKERRARREGETKEWHTSVFSNPSSVEVDEWDPPDSMTTPLSKEAWVICLIHCYSFGSKKAAFIRSSILPCSSPWSRNHLHFVLLWSWFQHQHISLCSDAVIECVWWVIPSCVTLHKVFATVETRRVWFAATATHTGPPMSHKVVTSPASNDQRRTWTMREEGGKVRYHWAAPVWACCCNNHTQTVTGCSRQSISLQDDWTSLLCRSHLRSLLASQQALRHLLLLSSASSKVWWTSLHAHTLWSDLSYQMVAPITHENIASMLINCYSIWIVEACAWANSVRASWLSTSSKSTGSSCVCAWVDHHAP